MPDINISTPLPGENLVVAVLDFISRNRESMSQENRDKWDAVGFNLFKAWHNWWVSKGWPGEPID